MQLSKKCPGCGWEYPIHSSRRMCVFCRTPILEGFCSRCGKYVDKLHSGMCITCRRKYKVECEMRLHEKNRTTAIKQFKSWIELIKSVPSTYPTLTQEQWLETCGHFDGCALCGDDHVDTRGFFISFKDGGRYCDWNIIPLCDKCATQHRISTNPFIHMHQRMGNKPTGSSETNSEYYFNSPKRLERIIEYLLPKLEEAANDERQLHETP